MTPAPPDSDAPILLHIEDGIGRITLNRPERLNAFAGGMRDDLHDAIVEAAAEESVRVLVIRGAGRGFCTGADVEAMSALLAAGDVEAFRALVQAGMRVVRAISTVRQPVIAAIHGPAAGAGASLAAACDLRIASEGASIGFTFNRIGLHPDWGASYFLPRLVGLGRARELIYTARMVDAREAERMGLFERVFPEATFEQELGAIVAALAAAPPLALAAARQTLARSQQSSLEEILGAEEEAQLRCFRSADAREGIAAFRARRPPRFQGE
ncbi:MAG: enoyl-CoA hydratase-related protein [Gemmatimonadota bacterium]|nr:enoyl-CoA hydratase-related protein [Gemmatimonadota bacterium]